MPACSHRANSQPPMQQNLFENPQDSGRFEEIELTDGRLRLYPGLFSGDQAARLLATLLAEIPWQQDQIRIAGKTLPVPRLQCWMGDAGADYGYSGIQLTSRPWHERVQALRKSVERLCNHSFNSVLLNLYRNGQDSVAWHADDEPELGQNPVIASLSLGAERPFSLKHRHNGERYRLILPSGSLLLMDSCTQHYWLHQLPKVKNLTQARINLTFRQIRTP